MRRLTTWWLAVSLAAVVGGLVAGLRAQEKPSSQRTTSAAELEPKAPTLTDVQKLQVLNAAKDLEIAQLKLDATRLAMQTLITAVTPTGYQINDRLELVKLPEPPPKGTP